MNIKHSILTASLFLFLNNLHPMQQIETVSTTELSSDEDENPVAGQEDKPNLEWAIVCIQKRTEQIIAFLPASLADLVSAYELPMPGENTISNIQLQFALLRNNPAETLSALNNFANINVKLLDRNDCLIYSVITNKHPEIIKTLLEYQANPNPPDDYLKLSLLHRVSNPCIIPILVQYKADVNAVDFRGRNPLYNKGGYYSSDAYDLIKTLIIYKANPNHIDNYDETPLFDAARAAHFEYIKALLEGKADVHATDKEGDTALHLAVGAIPEDKDDNAMKTETIQLLINANADLYAKNLEGQTVLDRAKIFDAKRKFKIADYILGVYNERQKALTLN